MVGFRTSTLQGVHKIKGEMVLLHNKVHRSHCGSRYWPHSGGRSSNNSSSDSSRCGCLPELESACETMLNCLKTGKLEDGTKLIFYYYTVYCFVVYVSLFVTFWFRLSAGEWGECHKKFGKGCFRVFQLVGIHLEHRFPHREKSWLCSLIIRSIRHGFLHTGCR